MAPTTAIAQSASGSCVPPPRPIPVGRAASCSQWHKVVAGDTCAKVAEQYNIDVQGFVELNPLLDEDCKNLMKGYTYCAAPCDGLTTSTSAPTDGAPSTGEDAYISYKGDGSQGWPSIDDWVTYEEMVATHRASLETACNYWQVKENTPEENDFLLETIRKVAEQDGVDPRVALAMALQESHGCLRVPGTTGAHSNPGIYQSHQGLGTCNTNKLITAGDPGPGIDGQVFEDCPPTMIETMVVDGISGTQAGDGLVQIMRQEQSKQYSGAQLWYRVARIYNSGRVAESGMLEDAWSGTTNAYVSDVANMLSGYIGESGFAR